MGNVSHMAACKSSSKITEKLNLQPVSNIELFLTHTESELGVLGIAGKLAKDVVHLWRQNFEKIIFFLPTGCPNNKRPLLGFKEF
jgi:hypothetical protein